MSLKLRLLFHVLNVDLLFKQVGVKSLNRHCRVAKIIQVLDKRKFLGFIHSQAGKDGFLSSFA